jgi:hypothetical protein
MVAFVGVSVSISCQCSAQSCLRWIERNPSHSPAMVSSRSMAFDSWRGVSVFYNGTDLMGGRGTWEWDGEDWFLRSTKGHEWGFRHAMVFDSRLGVTNSFGGSFAGKPTDELWQWNGIAWNRPFIPQPRPADRYSHAAAYDSARGRMVVFGGIGEGGSTLAATAEFDGERWHFPLVSQPPARRQHAMAYDSRRGVTVLFGGAGEASYRDTWEWDGVEWRQVATTGPSNSGATAMVYDSHRGVCVLFVGTFRETWEWDGVVWTQRQTNNPPARRALHAMTFDSHRNRVVLFGGQDGTLIFYDDTWEFGLYPDCDHSTGAGTLDIFDYLCFGNKFAQSDPYACNCDLSTGNNVCDIFDFLCFQNLFAAGCG